MIFGSLFCILQPKGEDVNIKRDDLARALMVCNTFVQTSSVFTGYILSLLSRVGLYIVYKCCYVLLAASWKKYTQIVKVILHLLLLIHFQTWSSKSEERYINVFILLYRKYVVYLCLFLCSSSFLMLIYVLQKSR